MLVHPDRNGYMYAMDRVTGEVLYAKPYVHITSSDSVSVKTGELALNPTKEPKIGQERSRVCPAAPGGKDWQPSSFSPRTGLVYVPHQNLCMDEEPTAVSYIAGTPYVGNERAHKAGDRWQSRLLTAWDPVAGHPVWRIPERSPCGAARWQPQAT